MTKATPYNPEITHAGGIVVRLEQEIIKYLVITAKKNPKHWVLPKGHIESGERIEETALREVLEETGIKARLLSPLNILQFNTGNKIVTAKFYLMAYVEDTKQSEERTLRWCSYDEALSILTFPDTKELLRLAKRKLRHFTFT